MSGGAVDMNCRDDTSNVPWRGIRCGKKRGRAYAFTRSTAKSVRSELSEEKLSPRAKMGFG